MQNQRYRISPHVVSNRIGDLLVVIQLQTDRIFSLNRTGSRLFDLMISGFTRAEIRSQLLQEFQVPEAQLDQEMEQMISSFTNEKLVMIEE